MERVQFQQEQMLAELKDLALNGLFTQAEIKLVMKKRTAFETALVRRVAKKGDFLRYASYEMGLETLRRKRLERLQLPPSPPSISDYALVRRQFYIFERALKKFKGDVGLWVQYLQVAKREGARALVGRISARALQLHPNSPALYILAASHELEHLSPSSARTLLQRGLRLNPESVDLWREYVKMELGFVESLRRRWEVLGVSTKPSKRTCSNAEVAMDIAIKDNAASNEPDALDDGEEAREEVMKGALVKAVISSAVKAIPKFPLFSALNAVLQTYPCPIALRHSLLEHLHDLLQSNLRTDFEPQAAMLYAARFLTPELEGDAMVDALRQANEDLIDAVKLGKADPAIHSALGEKTAEDMSRVYAQFVQEWFEKNIDDNLKLYLMTTLQALCAQSHSPSLLTTHLRLLASPLHPSPPGPQKLLKVARKYTSKAPNAPQVWLARLDVESAVGGKEAAMKVWEDARKHCARTSGSVEHEGLQEAVWFWGLERLESTDDPNTEVQLYQTLLREAIREPSLLALQEKLLIRYIGTLHAHSQRAAAAGAYKPGELGRELQRAAHAFLPNATVWGAAFDILAQAASPGVDAAAAVPAAEIERALLLIYDTWRVAARGACGDAALAWAGWLLRRRRGRDAADVVARARAGMAEEGRAGFETRWRAVLDQAPSGGSDDEGETPGEAGVGTST